MAKLTPAVGYLRKSTDGEDGEGRQRQEKSIPRQQSEIEALAKRHGCHIIEWYEDPGVSGWKRGAKRPDFQRMLNDAKENRNFTAILCEDLDRFSRANIDEVQADAFQLSQAGVERIITATDTHFLGGNDIGGIIKFVVSAWGANEFSRKLSRRISETRRNQARLGKRSGGNAPYGFVNDGAGGLEFGEPKQVRIVKRIYDDFVRKHRSMNYIASRLNSEGVVSPRGSKWFVAAVREMLQRPVYKGTFTYNRVKSGQFHICNDAGEIVDASKNRPSPRWKQTNVGMFSKPDAWKPMIEPAIWEAAQKRIASFSVKGSRRPRADGFALTGILRCDHCGGVMYGCHPKGRHRVYRCSSIGKLGASACKSYEIREELILPYVMKLLGTEIRDLEKLVKSPPETMRNPRRKQIERREELQRTRDKLAAKIGKAEENLMFVEDERTRKSLDGRIAAMRDELEQLDRDLEPFAKDELEAKYRREEVAALGEWWEQYEKAACRMPISGRKVSKRLETFYQAPEESDALVLLVDARAVNEALHSLGAEVRLRWDTTKTDSGLTRHVLSRGRLRLGRQNVTLPVLAVKRTGCGTEQWQSRRGSFR